MPFSPGWGVFGPASEAQWWSFVARNQGFGSSNWWPQPHPYSGAGNLGTYSGPTPGAVLPGRQQSEADRQARIAELEAQARQRSEFQKIMSQPVRNRRGVKKRPLPKPKGALVDFEAEYRKIRNPELDRILRQEVGKRPPNIRTKVPQPVKGPEPVKPKSLPETAADAAARRAATKVITRFIPGVGTVQNVIDAAQVVVAVIGEIQDKYAQRVLGPTVYPGYRGQRGASGPKSRGGRRRGNASARTAATRQTAPAARPLPVLRPALPAPQGGVSTVPASATQPGSATAPAPAPAQSKQARSARQPARSGGLSTARKALGFRFSFDPLAALFAGLGRRPSPSGRTSLGSAAATSTGIRTKENPYADLTASRKPGVGCSCPPGDQAKKRRRGKKSARSVCYSGTYIERAKGLSKRKKRRVPCR